MSLSVSPKSSVSQRARAILTYEASCAVPAAGGIVGKGEYHAEENPNLDCSMELPRTWSDRMFKYGETEGLPELREAIAKLLTITSHAAKPLDPNKMVIMNGGDVCLEAMAHVLCDAGEAVLVPVPFYYGLGRSLKLRPNVDVVPIPLFKEPRPGESQPFQLTADRAEEAYQKAVSEGVTVRALFLVNPSNPLGDVYSRKQVLDLLMFASRHDLHVVFDEVYMSTIYEEGVTHSSIFQFREDEIPDPQKVHFIWTFSKDLAMSGMHIAVNYTWNDEVCKALTSIAHFHAAPTGWQQAMARMLSDSDWFVNVFLATSVKRLKEAHSFFTQGLSELGVPCHNGGAGLFVWADFSKFLSAPTAEAEEELKQKLLRAGVQGTPSAVCLGQERGWFRLVFAKDKDTLETALARMQKALKTN
ncbi:1-aminocyclopropane-1-carboxylate synthase-like protein 1 isoform X2 [Acanthaster planci]|uniref:1-aminocyclopropane-1-carboxylate synthase-like protein 1 isoform X2 n=1 Tax=Acanthaster planci TaxID=133434 RepID=A0A8B7XUM6_ACAPL|nr:1-aminocyclopropane-1-carboxylate synthase-like protein 1 isoform X2 [Acanthaster planci]